MLPAFLTVLLLAAPAETAPALDLVDLEAPPAAYQLGASPRLAPAVRVRLDDAFPTQALPLNPASGNGPADGATLAPLGAVKKHSLATARRHFEDAKWTGGRNRGRELVVRSATVLFHPGPSYQVQLTVDRYEDGRRLGQATGSGFAQADRRADQTRAAFVPGPWGFAARNEAQKPRPAEDAVTIELAAVRALDHAFLQLGAVWAANWPATAAAPASPASPAAAPAAPADPTLVAGPTAMLRVANATSLPICDIRIWKDARPGHTDRDYNFIRNSRIAGGQTRPLLDGIPSSRYHFLATACGGGELMSKDLDLGPGDNVIVVK